MPDHPTTEELRETQDERETQERRAAETSTDEHETKTHSRRAAKLAYLKRKLKEREESERRARK